MRFEDTGFEGWVAQRGPALWRTAWLLTGDAHRAEDLVQTTLVRCWRAWARVEQADAYARRVMVTTYTDWRRRRWTGEVPTAAVGEPTTAGGPAVDGGVAVDVDLRHDVLTALATLPGGQRAVVVLRFYDDLSVTETAAALGVSAGTVKSQTSRAMAALRTCGLLSRPGTEDA